MNWDEKAKQNAIWCGYNSLALGVAEAKGIQTVYIHAARWQRDQLRTTDPIERMAKALYEQSSAYKWHGAKWYDLPEDQREGIKKSAKVAVGALLGED